jgi:hypothetical protein
MFFCVWLLSKRKKGRKKKKRKQKAVSETKTPERGRAEKWWMIRKGVRERLYRRGGGGGD